MNGLTIITVKPWNSKLGSFIATYFVAIKLLLFFTELKFTKLC